MTRISQVAGREILDSRGNPTVEVDVTLDDGSFGRAAVPSGASTGAREAVELRDGDKTNWHGRGVSKAVANVNGPIREAIMGLDASVQKVVDQTLIDLDGTDNKGRLGANAILGVSLASMKAAAASLRTPLYRYLGGVGATLLPTPMMNIVNGGAHADNPLDFQEFMIVPVGAKSFYGAVKIGSEVFHTLKGCLAKAGHSTNVGDEGGFAPDFSTAEEALDFVVGAIEQTGYVPGDDVAIALDPAASEFYRAGTYTYGGIGIERSVDQQVEYLISLVERYPILSLEDAVAEDDHEGWQKLTAAIGDRCQLVGDDVFCTNPRLLSAGIAAREANAILVKLNQIGTYSELLQAVDIAKRAGYGVVVSHRSGETEDTTISDIVVGTGVGQLKTGSLSRSDRTAKYNQLLRIEEELGSSARYDGVLPMLASTGRA